MRKPKPPRRPRTITRVGLKRPVDTGQTAEELRERLQSAEASETSANPDEVVGLKRSHIRVAERVFQWRVPERNMLPRDDHILDLARALRDGAQLPPILVFPVGREYYVMDGHHRLAAYDTAGWTKPIPARVFSGTLREAERVALRSNNRNQLNMTRRDRTSAAWRLVKEEYPGDSIASIAEDSGASKSRVSDMRAVLKKLKDMGVDAEDIADASWDMARIIANGRTEESQLEDWLEAEANKLVEDIVRYKLGGRLTKNPDITALALAKLNEGLPAALIEYWREEPEEQVREFDPYAHLPDEDNF